MATSFKRTYARAVVFSALEPTAGQCRPTPTVETPGYSQASLSQSLVGLLLLSSGSWCTQGFVSDLQESVSPVLWKFCNQIPLAFKVKVSGGSQSLCQITRLGNLLWALELSQQCRNFSGITVCQSVGCLLSGSTVGLTRRASQLCCSESTIPVTGQCWPAPQQETLKHSKAGLAQSPVGPLGPGVHKVLFEPSEHLWRAWGLILNMISALLLSCWDFFALGCGVSLFGGIQHSPVNGCSMVSCNFGVLTGEDERMSFYSATWKTQQWPQDQKKSVFIPIPKKGNAKECSNYHTTALTSHASKIMLKILEDRLQQYVNRETPDVQTRFRKAFKKDFKKADIKLPISVGQQKKQESYRKTFTSAS